MKTNHIDISSDRSELCLVLAAAYAHNNQLPAPLQRNLRKPRPRLPLSKLEKMPVTTRSSPAWSLAIAGLRVVGDLNKYQSDLNYKAGPRLFDSSFLMRSKDGKGVLFDTLLVTSTGWGCGS